VENMEVCGQMQLIQGCSPVYATRPSRMSGKSNCSLTNRNSRRLILACPPIGVEISSQGSYVAAYAIAFKHSSSWSGFKVRTNAPATEILVWSLNTDRESSQCLSFVRSNIDNQSNSNLPFCSNLWYGRTSLC